MATPVPPPAERCEVVVVWPFWSQSGALNWDSNWIYVSKVLPRLAELYPLWQFIVLWPQKGKRWKWKDTGLFDHENIHRYPWPYPTSMIQGVRHFDAYRFKDLEQRYGPTLYWMNMVEAAAQISRGYTSTATRAAQPSIAAQHHYIIHESLPEPNDPATHSRGLLQIIGTIAADAVAVNSEHTRTMMVESFGKVLSEDRIRKILDKTTLHRFGLVDEPLLSKEVREYEKPVVVYNHRMELYKQPDKTADVLRELRDAGYDFEVWLTQHIGQSSSKMPADRLVGDPDYDTYIDNIAVPAINTINSKHETFCISMLDSMALGHLPVVPNRVTFPEIVPDGYPFVFESTSEQRDMIAHIIDNWQSVRDEWSGKLVRRARTTFAIDKYVERYGAWLDRVAQTWTGSTPKDSTIETLETVASVYREKRATLGDVRRRISRIGGLQSHSMPEGRVVRELSARGVRWRVRGKELVTDPKRS